MQELVRKVREKVRDLLGHDGDDDDVRAELARAYDHLRYPATVRLRPAASILARDELRAEVDEAALVSLAAQRVAALVGTRMPSEREQKPSEDLRLGVATRAYDGYSFGSRCELARENPPPENRVAR